MLAIIRSSGRVINVERCGRVLIVKHNRRSVSTPIYDDRFQLLPACATVDAHGNVDMPVGLALRCLSERR